MTSRSRYSFSELADFARQGGWEEHEIPQAVAIAMAESGGNPLALNDNPTTGDRSFGLMQINMLGKLRQPRLTEFGLQDERELYDPVTNFRAAKAIRDSQGWPAWSVYKSGRYKNFLPGVEQSLAAAPAAGNATAGLDLLDTDLGGVGIGGAGRPSQSEPSGPLSAMAAALAQRSLDDAAGRGREPGRMALGSGAQAAVIEALVPEQQVSGTSASRLSIPTEAEPMAVASGGELDIVRLGQKLKNLGLTVREHPEFGGVGKHSPNSHHYAGNALDLTIQPGSPLLAGLPDSSWRDLTRQYGAKLKQVIPGAEIFHPGDDPVGGHDSHIHLALPSGRTALTEPLMRLLGA